jgi:hypothetical protein
MERKPKCIIVDMDGTLSNASHRQHLVREKPKQFDKFYDLCGLDEPHLHVITAVQALAAHYPIVIVSGRIERTRGITIEWLIQHRVPWHEMHMRPNGDFREDHILKAEILDQKILPKWEPMMAFDDRDRVVAMWRQRGIPCMQVAEGNF